MVVGIVFILGTGFVTVAFWPGSPGREVIGILFGIGAALTLDEFALWLYLRDVYWSPEGRSSIDATVIGLVFGTLLLVGSSPFGAGAGGREPRVVAFAMVGLNVVLALITFLKKAHGWNAERLRAAPWFRDRLPHRQADVVVGEAVLFGERGQAEAGAASLR